MVICLFFGTLFVLYKCVVLDLPIFTQEFDHENWKLKWYAVKLANTSKFADYGKQVLYQQV